ncbi:MAG: heavy metal-responsive transcriptional regulator [Gammaproteobacteria bacterium]|nr:heavy metal-responsive transcriptional regulator [Gammaproteobacteria bacterium]NIR82582.1 heavy metal-responsive transcriptional regulator [Gammaproteobacteria bacterium]NIR88785.1 heavy metal-responsive transcriptional regulator [Gammaproteobacteria bacterium]NIV73990.1 MerR family DNA-binding protein [Gammaproteobacteria bacterium]
MHCHAISEAARRLGISPDTLRYYERIGLLPAVARAPSGARLYREGDLGRLRFIRRAQRMGFTLAEIQTLLNVRDAPDDARAEVRALAARKLGEIEAALDELAELLARCGGSETPCPILEAMNEAVRGTHESAGCTPT